MAYPKFELDLDVLQFTRGIRYPVHKPGHKIQVMDETAGGTIQREDFGPSRHEREMIFRNLPEADFAALCNWYDVMADGSMNEFTYYDEDGVAMTVIMITSPYDTFKETSYQRHSGVQMLRVVD